MALLVRRLLALLSGLGLAASLLIYCASFSGLTLDRLGLWWPILHIAAFVLFAPICIIERSAIKVRTFYWDRFAQGKPSWVVPGIKLLTAFWAVHFVLFLMLSRASSPKNVGGQFVLDDHGTIKKILTEREYLHLRSDELRFFATGWIDFYLLATAYWWFSRPLDKQNAERLLPKLSG